MNPDHLLKATPYWYGEGSYQPGNAEENLASVVRPLVDQKRWTAGDTHALRVLAYAHHVAALSEEEIRERLIGTDADLAADVISLISGNVVSQEELERLIDASLSGRSGTGHLRHRSIQEGWLRAILELISDIRPDLIPLILAQNTVPTFFLLWLLHRWSTSAAQQDYANVLLSKTDEQSWRIGAAFLSNVALEHVLHRGVEPSLVGAPDARLIAGGLMLTQLARMRFIPAVLRDPDAQARLGATTDRVAAEVSALLKGNEIRDLVKRSQSDDAALVAVLLTKSDGKTLRALAAEGDELLNQYFRKLTAIEPASQEQSLPYLSAFVLDDLLEIWVRIRAGIERFDSLKEALRYDEHAYEFTYSHYLIDRRRAIILAAVAGMAASKMGDVELLEAVRSLAAQLHDMPAGVVQPFAEDVLAEMREAGIDLPSA